MDDNFISILHAYTILYRFFRYLYILLIKGFFGWICPDCALVVKTIRYIILYLKSTFVPSNIEYKVSFGVICRDCVLLQ